MKSPGWSSQELERAPAATVPFRGIGKSGESAFAHSAAGLTPSDQAFISLELF
jgi:hypothetical protein